MKISKKLVVGLLAGMFLMGFVVLGIVGAVIGGVAAGECEAGFFPARGE